MPIFIGWWGTSQNTYIELTLRMAHMDVTSYYREAFKGFHGIYPFIRINFLLKVFSLPRGVVLSLTVFLDIIYDLCDIEYIPAFNQFEFIDFNGPL